MPPPFTKRQSAIVQRTQKILAGAWKTSITEIRRLAAMDDPSTEVPPYVSRIVFPALSTDDTILDLLCRATEGLGSRNNHYTTPSIREVDARWTTRNYE